MDFGGAQVQINRKSKFFPEKIISYKLFFFIILLTFNSFFLFFREEQVKKIPVHVLRTLTYHPVLIPNNPVAPPMTPFHYGRGFLSQYQGNLHQNSNPSAGMNPYAAGSNNYNTYQTNPPPTPSSSSTTQRPTTTPAPQTTTTTASSPPSTTTETTTTFQQQDQFPQMSGKFSAKSPMLSDRFNQFPFEYSPYNGASQMSASVKGQQDPYNLQYVTNIAPMNVQVVLNESFSMKYF